jgi:glutaconate CoA-transferase subunit B
LDFLTTIGDRTTHVITDLGVLVPGGGELTLIQVHPGVSCQQVRDATERDLRIADEVRSTDSPSDYELAAPRELAAR